MEIMVFLVLQVHLAYMVLTEKRAFLEEKAFLEKLVLLVKRVRLVIKGHAEYMDRTDDLVLMVILEEMECRGDFGETGPEGNHGKKETLERKGCMAYLGYKGNPDDIDLNTLIKEYMG